MKRALLLTLVIGTILTGLWAAPTAAEPADYYNDSDTTVDNSTWYEGVGNASLDSLGDMATRLGPYFIGTGEMDQSGTGYQGAILTGLIMVGTIVGAIAGLPVGAVGGSVLAVVVGYGMTSIGLAPQWFRPILLFGIGIIVFVALSRVMDGR